MWTRTLELISHYERQICLRLSTRFVDIGYGVRRGVAHHHEDVRWAAGAFRGGQVMRQCAVIVLTGGPGGGKTTLLQELRHDLAWAGRFVALPEAIFLMRHVGISPRKRLFQRVMVHLQIALEDGLDRALGPGDPRPILCHRGSLDPLAYWLDRGWPEEEFFPYTETTREDHYRRYTGVIHLVTAADGAEDHYAHWPEAHRPEQIEDAIRLDGLLHRVWRDHPCYYRIDNAGRGWTEKSEEARQTLGRWLAIDLPCSGDKRGADKGKRTGNHQTET